MLVQLVVVGLLAANAVGSPTAPSRVQRVQPVQRTVVLLESHRALASPDRSGRMLRKVAATRPITGGRTVLPVVGSATDAAGRHWLRVRLPGRPNSGLGWIERKATVAQATRFHLVVEIAQRRLVVYRDARAVRRFDAIVGMPSTPTPRGTFFIEEAVQLPPAAVGAPFALALSGRSDVYQEFAGGPGQIAIHSLSNVGGSLGTAASHGCVRLTRAAMSWLVLRVGPGVPVTVR